MDKCGHCKVELVQLSWCKACPQCNMFYIPWQPFNSFLGWCLGDLLCQTPASGAETEEVSPTFVIDAASNSVAPGG